jgi:hypothetical protein
LEWENDQQAIYGGSHPTPIQVFLALTTGMVISIISLLIPANDGFYRIMLSTIGATWATAEFTVDSAYLGQASFWALVFGGVEAGIAMVTPIAEFVADG